MVVGNIGSVGAPERSFSHALSTVLVSRTNGVRRSLRPLPSTCTLAPVESVMSAQVSAASSEIRSPAWIVSTNIAWSRRPVQVVWSHAASRASTSGSVR